MKTEINTVRIMYVRISSLISCLLGCWLCYSCQKIEYTEMKDPAYLRVFNSLNLPDLLENTRQDSLPYLCMLVNPVLDAAGNPVSAEIVGDFLKQRELYAPPYPVHIGASTSVDNPEYPGKENVLVGPVLNGFDLSSWAQVPAGKLTFLFMYRPKNSTPFFELAPELRKSKAVAGEFELTSGEVYTLQALYANFSSRSRTLLLRREDFHKQAFSDSLTYVNFYNYSAQGYQEAPASQKLPNGKIKRHLFEGGIKDTMDVYLTLMKGQDFVPYQKGIVLRNGEEVAKSYSHQYLYTVRRNIQSAAPAPYVSFPLWVKGDDNGVYTDIWQRFYFISPSLQVTSGNHPFYEYGQLIGDYLHIGGPFIDPKGQFALLNCLLNGPIIYTGRDRYEYHMGENLPNMIINTHSGVDNPKSFPSANTVEVINGQAYLMTMQRKYAPPIYN
ncbi:hypothetical protein [Sphingobacterium sp. BIGb0165]|uniref:hypothetical protein n=1 Tax=Sphingobacterium sp. BIGb0165 TaxID=2940615 RepID=UPI002168013C|nr:hypothetical protein [Sphingobacterium sp. BIGb0165]MCS4226979.1 hypothetical protein [Sphingobacterium sp. BIGb0165]